MALYPPEQPFVEGAGTVAFELNVGISVLRAGPLANSLQDAHRLHRFPVLTQMLNYIPSKSYKTCSLMEGFCVTFSDNVPANQLLEPL